MKILRNELRKVIRQIQGQENIFSYKSTEANQLYLLYCLNGKIYFSDMIHHQVKYLWFMSLALEISVNYFASISNLWYRTEKDFMLMFDVMNLLGACKLLYFGLPLISFWFRDDIEAMIEQVDKIFATRSNKIGEKHNNTMNIKRVTTIVGVAFLAIFMTGLVYLFDVVFYFEQEKMDNRFNYQAAIPLAEQFRSPVIFFIYNGLLSAAIAQLLVRNFAGLSFVLYWSMMCYNEMIRIANEIDTFGNNLNAFVECEIHPSEVWNGDFADGLVHQIKRFQKISTIIEKFRGFFQSIATVTIPTAFMLSVAQLHITITENLPFILMLKSLGITLNVILITFLLHWTSQILYNGVSEVSFAVYSTPWYWSIKSRKTVYIFLCQTQKMKNLEYGHVYPLLLQNFTRYLNGILSCTNALRKLTQKASKYLVKN